MDEKVEGSWDGVKNEWVSTGEEFSCKEGGVGGSATIHYQKLPEGRMLIIGFENFLSMDDIKEKHGDIIHDAYFQYPYFMDLCTDTDTGEKYLSLVHYGGGEDIESIQVVSKYDIFTRKEFSKIVAHIKKCGQLLHDIIDARINGMVKSIKI